MTSPALAANFEQHARRGLRRVKRLGEDTAELARTGDDVVSLVKDTAGHLRDVMPANLRPGGERTIGDTLTSFENLPGFAHLDTIKASFAVVTATSDIGVVLVRAMLQREGAGLIRVENRITLLESGSTLFTKGAQALTGIVGAKGLLSVVGITVAVNPGALVAGVALSAVGAGVLTIYAHSARAKKRSAERASEDAAANAATGASGALNGATAAGPAFSPILSAAGASAGGSGLTAILVRLAEIADRLERHVQELDAYVSDAGEIAHDQEWLLEVVDGSASGEVGQILDALENARTVLRASTEVLVHASDLTRGYASSL